MVFDYFDIKAPFSTEFGAFCFKEAIINVETQYIASQKKIKIKKKIQWDFRYEAKHRRKVV